MKFTKSDRHKNRSKRYFVRECFNFLVLTCIESTNSHFSFSFHSQLLFPALLFIFMPCFNSKIIRRQNHHPPNIAIQYLHSTTHHSHTSKCLYQEDLLHQSFPHRRVRHKSPELPRRRFHTPLLPNLQPALRLPPSPAPSTPMPSSLTTLLPITRHR